MAPPPPPALMDDVIGEILLRLPPDDPACLFRASLVCKPWRCLLSDPAFSRQYRAFHRTPPPEPNCWILDCRHGRVLLHSFGTPGLVLWDPIAAGKQHLPQPVNQYAEDSVLFAAAVLCASDGCDHLDCRGGPFLVVFAGTQIDDEYGDDEDAVTWWVSVYSSETGAWSTEVSAHLGPILDGHEVMGSSLLADALYFTLEEGQRILKYDLVGRVLPVINAPPTYVGNMALMTAEDGRLGIAGVKGYRLHLWAWWIGPNGIEKWARGRITELDMMISIAIGDPSTKLHVVGFAEGAGSIFIRANDGIFTVELKSGRVRKIGKRGDFNTIFPFMSFYTPGTNLMHIDIFHQL
ncbi:hypothetical protein BAE44_0020593 [Dichanthelium oligosanthes]|uniref:Uncharacterized protein n=1 Tax=Dichanthelium oligosanthes TaxID=888268 RepID=A0A1E5UZX3_9POAL|nr:hypothetical protein BAE44_0020593 [Dichanthelium oligosanthes]